MSISFETEDGTVLLAETESILFDPKQMKDAIKRDGNIRRLHLYPLLEATAHFACSLRLAPQGCKPFDLSRSPWITIIGDDMHFAWGPQAFPMESLDAAIKGADNCVLITSGPEPFAYRVAATLAARDRRNVLLIESLPHQQEAWRAHIEAIRGENGLPICMCLPRPDEPAA